MKRFSAALLVLAGCAAPPGPIPPDWDPKGAGPAEVRIEPNRFRDYHAYLKAQILAKITNPSVPQDVRNDYAECSASAIVGQLTPEEVGRYNQLARGEISIPVPEVEQMNDEIYRRAGTRDPWEFIRPYCPEQIARFQTVLKK